MLSFFAGGGGEEEASFHLFPTRPDKAWGLARTGATLAPQDGDLLQRLNCLQARGGLKVDLGFKANPLFKLQRTAHAFAVP